VSYKTLPRISELEDCTGDKIEKAEKEHKQRVTREVEEAHRFAELASSAMPPDGEH
jgi:hypothetical protein